MSLTPTQPDPLETQMLLHAAGELPADELEALQQALAGDAELRGRFAAIEADFARTANAFEATDGQLHISEGRAGTRAVDAIRRWQLGLPVEAVAEVRPADPPAQRWGWATGIAALVAVGLGIAAVVAYIDSTRSPRQPMAQTTADAPELPTDGQENALAIHAATSLAIGLDLDDETLPMDPMPPVAEIETFAMSGDDSFFNLPLIVEADIEKR